MLSKLSIRNQSTPIEYCACCKHPRKLHKHSPALHLLSCNAWKIKDSQPKRGLETPSYRLAKQSKLVCLFVGLFHGIPVVRGGRRLTKDGFKACVLAGMHPRPF